MKVFIIFLVIAVISSFQCIIAQVDNHEQKSSSTSFVTKVNGLLDRADNELIKKHNINEQFFNSDVQLQQIGNHNTFNTQLKAKKVAVEVVQKGSNNSVYLNKFAKSIDQKIFQIGNNNTVFDYSTYTNLEIKTEFVQQGNNQTIMSFGSNSISRDLKIEQSGKGSSLVLINN
jgi:minor curlin subunit